MMYDMPATTNITNEAAANFSGLSISSPVSPQKSITINDIAIDITQVMQIHLRMVNNN